MANAPTFQAAGTAVSATTGTLTVAWPTHQVNDMALLFVTTSGGNNIALTTANGFTLMASYATGSTTAGTRLSVFWCRATSSAMSSPVITATTDFLYAQILTYRGVITTGTPYAQAKNGGTKATASTTATIPSSDTPVANTLIVLAISSDLDSASAFLTSMVNSSLTSITERVDAGTVSGGGGGIAVSDGIKATAGFIGTTTATITSSINAFQIIPLLPADPTISQSAFRFYEDGTESASVGTLGQNTSITKPVTVDTAVQLRARLQETGAVSGISTDNYQLQYSLNGGLYTNLGLGASTIADSYPESNFATPVVNGSSGSFSKAGQSFTGNGNTLTGAAFYLAKNGAITGYAKARIYAHTGTFGTSSLPTGDALATSTDFDVSTLAATPSYTLINFAFSNGITLGNGTKYVLTIEYDGIGTSSSLFVGTDNTSPTHNGNLVQFILGTWSATSTSDLIFYVYTATSTGTPVIGFDSTNLTEGQVTTNRLGAGTGSFTTGKVSEDGVVDNNALPASNFTELLYSIKLVSVNLQKGDSLSFRILRNANIIATYSVIPAINIGVFSFNQSITAKTAGGTSTTTAMTTTTGNALLIGIGLDDASATVSNVTDNMGNTFIRANSIHGGDFNSSELWYCGNITGGAGHTITATSSNSGDNVFITAMEFLSYNGPLSIDQTTASHTSTTTTGSTGTTATTTAADEVSVAFSVNDTGHVMTSTYNGTTTLVTSGTLGSAMAYKFLTATGTQSATFTDSAAADMASIIATFKAGVVLTTTTTTLTKASKYTIKKTPASLTKGLIYNVSPGMTTLTDSLTSFNGTLWTQSTAGGGAISYGTTGMTITFPSASTASTLSQIVSNYAYDLTGGSVSLMVSAIPSSTTAANAELRLQLDINNYIRFVTESGTLFAQYRVNGARTNANTATYSATTHKYWKIGESGGTVTFWTSPDGGTWTSFGTVATPINIRSLSVQIIGSAYQNETNPGTFAAKNVNITTVTTTTALNSTLRYNVRRTPSALTKSSIYTTKTSPIALTRLAKYTIKKANSQFKGLKYTIARPATALTKTTKYTITKTATALTKVVKYTVKAPASLTKSLKYTARTTHGALTKSLRYATKPSVSVTKPFKYTVKTARTAITKSNRYAVRTTTAFVYNLKYTVKHPASVTKTLKYTLKSPAAISKALKYTIRTTPAAITKAISYRTDKAASITKSLRYDLRMPTVSLTKTAKYTLLKSNAITKPVKYTIAKAATALTKSAKYTVKKPVSVTKALVYDVRRTASAITKSTRYAIMHQTAFAYNLRYDVRLPSTAITKALKYEIKRPGALTKALAYRVRTSTAATKSLTYIVTGGNRVIKALAYTVKAPRQLTKSLRYDVKLPTVGLTKALKYTIKRPTILTKQVKYTIKTATAQTRQVIYRIKRPNAQTKGLIYDVRKSTAITKPVQYRVRTSTNKTKGMQYDVRRTSAITKGLTYKIRQAAALTKSNHYSIRTPRAKTVSLTYRLNTAARLTKSLWYVISLAPTVTRAIVLNQQPESVILTSMSEVVSLQQENHTLRLTTEEDIRVLQIEQSSNSVMLQ